MRGLLFILMISTTGGRAAEAGAPRLEYRFKMDLAGKAPALVVDVLFDGAPSGATHLRLPSVWAGQRELYKAVRELQVLTPGATLADGADPESKTVAHAPSQPLHLRYRVEQDWTGLIAHEIYYRTLIRPDYFHLIGHSFLVVPAWDDEKAVRATFDWKALPPGWSVGNSHGAQQRRQVVVRPLSDITHAVYVGGDFRFARIMIKSSPVWIAMRGRWKFGDREFADLAEKVLHSERGFWNDYDFPYFLITLIPTDNEGSAGGTGLTDSFATFVSTDQALGADLTYLLSHELFHTWNGGKIRRVEPEASSYWFSEGFTDYYTHLLDLRAGLSTPEEYLGAYNKIAKAYYGSSVRNAPNERITRDFWNDREVERLPYQRGFLLAHNWNARIKERSAGRHSLDDVMRGLLHDAETAGAKMSSRTFDAAMAGYLPGGVSDDLEKFVERGETIVPDPTALGPCARLKMTETEVYELGFDWRATEPDKIVREVVPGSAADAAGLRDGQRLSGYSIHHGDTTKEVVLTIGERKGRKTIQYRPVKKFEKDEARPRVPQFEWDAARLKADPESCLRWFE